MKTRTFATGLAAIILLSGCSSTHTNRVESSSSAQAKLRWQEDFGLSGRELVPTGRNPYFILEPGFQLAFASEDERLTITVLEETVKIDEVITRVVEEREWKNGKLIEVSRNFLAICKDTERRILLW